VIFCVDFSSSSFPSFRNDRKKKSEREREREREKEGFRRAVFPPKRRKIVERRDQ
jgi:hypothetical protein